MPRRVLVRLPRSSSPASWRILALGGSHAARDSHPWGSAPGLREEAVLRRLQGPAFFFFFFSLFLPTEILCHLPTGHFFLWPALDGSRILPAGFLISPPHTLGSPNIVRPRGVGEQSALPWHLHVATAGPDRLVQHLEAHGAVKGRDGQLWGSSALQGPRGGRGGRGFAAIAAQHGAHSCASHPDSCQELSACCRVVLLSCGGGRKSQPSCDRRLPARPANAAYKQSQSQRPTSV